MKKELLIIGMIMLITLPAAAQLTEKWEQQMDGPFTSERYSSSCPDGEGGVIAVGQQYNSDTGKSEAIFARFNEQGELLWEGVHSGGNTYSRVFEDVAPMYPYPNLFLAVGSTNFEGDTWFLTSVISIDGNLGSSTSWDFADGGWLNRIELTTFGLVACGTTELIDGQQSGIVMRINDVFDIPWWQTYGTYERNFLDDIVGGPGGYWATGWGWSGEDRAPWILNLEYDGDLISSNYYPQYDGAYPASICNTGTNDMMVGGYSLISGNSQYWAMRVDVDGNEVWNAEYGAVDGNENGKFIAESSLGGFWMLGDGISQQSDGRDIWAIRIDDNGDLLNSTIFNQGGDQTMWKGANMNGEEFVMTGYHNDGNPSQKSLISWFSPTQPLEVSVEATYWPFTIPYSGEGFTYYATGTNNTDQPMIVDAWLVVEHVYTEVTVTVRLFEDVELPPFSTVNTLLQQYIPAAAPSGEFRYRLFVGDHPWQSQASDWFTFWKSGPVLLSGTEIGDVFEQPELWPVTGSFGADELVIATHETTQPDKFALSPAYPNPFNPGTSLSVNLPEATELIVAVYNVSGRKVAELANGTYTAGSHTLSFNASNLAGGVYFVRAAAKGWSDVQKVVLMK